MRYGVWLLMLFALGCTRVNNPTKSGGEGATKKGEPWPTAAAELARSPELLTAKQVLPQLNSDLEAAEMELPGLSAEAVSKLAARCPPTPDEKADWESRTFTPTDAVYLGECLYFHQLARALEIDHLGEEAKAKAAFDWVCRVVYPRPWTLMLTKALNAPKEPRTMPPVPPAEVLRRGYGTGYERAAVFLALSRQLGLEAFLLAPPGTESKQVWDPKQPADRGPFWAVGVRSGQDILLFDPWIGEAIPSADGKSIAKLSALKTDFTFVRAWYDAKKWTAAPKNDEMFQSVPYASVPMNALTPRMKVLEDKLHKDIGLTLAVDPGDCDTRWKNFGAKWYSPPLDMLAARLAPTHQLAYYTIREEGGFSDEPAERSQAYIHLRTSAVQADSFPVPAELSVEYVEARAEFQEVCASQYRGLLVEPGFRDRFLRGQYTETLQQLVELDRTFGMLKQQLRSAADVRGAVQSWYAMYKDAYTKKARALHSQNANEISAVDAMMKSLWAPNSAGYTITRGFVAEFGSHEVDYLMAVCKHEMAEQSERKHAKAPTADTARERKANWLAAKQSWARYRQNAARFEDVYPGRAAHAAGLAARAEQLGNSSN